MSYNVYRVIKPLLLTGLYTLAYKSIDDRGTFWGIFIMNCAYQIMGVRHKDEK